MSIFSKLTEKAVDIFKSIGSPINESLTGSKDVQLEHLQEAANKLAAHHDDLESAKRTAENDLTIANAAQAAAEKERDDAKSATATAEKERDDALAKLKSPENFEGFAAAVDQKAQEQISNAGAPSNTSGNSSGSNTGATGNAYEQYNALTDPLEKAKFFQANKSKIISAARAVDQAA